MGRKKAKRVKVKRVIPKLETRFDCLKCHHENVVQCKILKGDSVGVAYCSICEARYKCSVNSLDRPIDIYHYWADSLHKEK